MKNPLLFAYQVITAASDTSTGALLYLAPAFTLRMMGAHMPPNAAPYVSYIGAFVLSVGLACLYGLRLVAVCDWERLQVVWLLTALPRAAVAIYLIMSIATGQLEPAWLSVALFDGACAALQGIGLRRRWLRDAK